VQQRPQADKLQLKELVMSTVVQTGKHCHPLLYRKAPKRANTSQGQSYTTQGRVIKKQTSNFQT
jgi:hypothetical protein